MITYNALPADANLDDLLEQLKRDIFLTLNCHAHATVQSFDPSNQTITATINYQKTIFISNQPGQLPVPTAVSYPIVVGCPVYFPQGGGASLTLPVAKGDQCVIGFNDRDMDNYLAASVIGPCNTARAHSFSDAFAFVGLNPLRKALSNFDMARALLQYQGAKVGCSENGVLIQANSVKLSTAISDLVTAVNTFMEGIVTAGTPSPTSPVLWSGLLGLAASANAALVAAQEEFNEVLE